VIRDLETDRVDNDHRPLDVSDRAQLTFGQNARSFDCSWTKVGSVTSRKLLLQFLEVDRRPTAQPTFGSSSAIPDGNNVEVVSHNR
jgi:hypothetical protein